jgi:hypothetical protein
MSTWDLNRLRYTIRKLTGKYDATQLPDTSTGEVSISNPSGIDDYINDYYLYDFPQVCRTLKLRDFFYFNTVPNCGTYSLGQNIEQIYDPVYVDNYQQAWYQFPDQFYNIWPELDFIDRNLWSGNGAQTIFSGTLTQFPVQQGTVVIGMTPNIDGSTVPTETFEDQDQPIPLDIPTQQIFVNPGILVSNQYTGTYPPLNPGVTPGTGTIDYLTGAVTVSYVNAPPAGTTCSCHYHPYVASRPRDLLFWQQQLFIRPIPNDTYSVKLMAYMMPTTVMSSATNATVRPSLDANGNVQGFSGNSGSLNTDLPQFNEWWQVIAYGAALKIFVEDGDHQEYEQYKQYYEEQRIIAQRKAIKQFASQRIPTAYADNNRTSPSWPIFPLY